jgi:hypothetical protein
MRRERGFFSTVDVLSSVMMTPSLLSAHYICNFVLIFCPTNVFRSARFCSLQYYSVTIRKLKILVDFGYRNSSEFRDSQIQKRTSPCAMAYSIEQLAGTLQSDLSPEVNF